MSVEKNDRKESIKSVKQQTSEVQHGNLVVIHTFGSKQCQIRNK